jgi:type I restriction enzyme S subunit
MALGLRSHGKGTFQRLVDRPETVAMETLYQVEPNELIVNITFAWEGAIAITKLEDKGCLTSHRFPMYKVDENLVLIDYLRYVILAKRFVFNLGLSSPGGAGRNRVLNKKDFLKLKIPVPPLEKQKQIANVLRTADWEIDASEQYLSLLKEQKQGLMQKLLTGDWRVPVEAEVAA